MLGWLETVELRQSDREFLIQLFRDYERLMFATARRYIPEQSACEDIIQDSLEKLMKRIRVLQSMESCVLAGYIVSTVRNTSFNYLKQCGRARERQCSLEEEQVMECAAEARSLDEQVSLSELKARLSALWPQLSEEEQILLEGKYILGYTDQELALQVECKPASIRMKLTRARRKALQILREGKCSDKA